MGLARGIRTGMAGVPGGIVDHLQTIRRQSGGQLLADAGGIFHGGVPVSLA